MPKLRFLLSSHVTKLALQALEWVNQRAIAIEEADASLVLSENGRLSFTPASEASRSNGMNSLWLLAAIRVLNDPTGGLNLREALFLQLLEYVELGRLTAAEAAQIDAVIGRGFVQAVHEAAADLEDGPVGGDPVPVPAPCLAPDPVDGPVGVSGGTYVI